ncbi:MAG: hypothetical protein JWM98_2435 [Thermoleophilia bacterium]|nr:hypothetical protein [Thermoleophilia bacterium]
MNDARPHSIRTGLVLRLILALAAALLVAGCGQGDPGAIGPTGVDGGLSPEGKRQDYVDGVTRALGQLSQATQTPTYAKSVESGNKKSLQLSMYAWRQGGEQLKGLDPPKDAVPGHTALIKAVEGLDAWNQRLVKAAPNKFLTKKLARQAADSAASRQYGDAICTLVAAGYDVVDADACGTGLDAASPPAG